MCVSQQSGWLFFFSQWMTCSHFQSPFQGQTAQSLAQLRAQVVISLSGIDETVSQAVHAQYLFHGEEILWNYRLVDIIHETPAGDCYIDFTHFYDVVSLQALA